MDWKWGLGAGLAGTAGLAGAIYLGYRIGKTSSSSKTIGASRQAYLNSHNLEDHTLGELRELSLAHARGRMTSGRMSGKLLTLLCRVARAQKVLDIGVFTGVSSYSMALALPEDGRVVSCDISDEYAALGRPYWERGGVSGKIDLRIKPASETLQELLDGGGKGTFDLVFIDADKLSYPVYLELGVKLLRVGGLLVVDNALWSGRVADPAVQDDGTAAIRKINDCMRDDPGLEYVLLDICDGIGLAQKL